MPAEKRDWKPGYDAKLEGAKSEAAQKEQDAERIPLMPKEKEVYLRTRRNNSMLTAEDLGSTEEVLDMIEEKGWVKGDFDVWAQVRRYWRLPNWDDDACKGNGYDPRWEASLDEAR